MSNLGGYQLLTTAAKKVGGPRNLVLLIAGTSVLVYKCGEIVVSKVTTEVIKMKYAKKRLGNEISGEVYIVKSFGISDEGLQFKVNEQFKVLETDGDAVLIEKIGDMNNPYFISGDFLKEISDYTN